MKAYIKKNLPFDDHRWCTAPFVGVVGGVPNTRSEVVMVADKDEQV